MHKSTSCSTFVHTNSSFCFVTNLIFFSDTHLHIHLHNTNCFHSDFFNTPAKLNKMPIKIKISFEIPMSTQLSNCKIYSFLLLLSFANKNQYQKSPNHKIHTYTRYLADSKPPKPAIKSSTLPRTSSQGK